jgi:hypothetical protein
METSGRLLKFSNCLGNSYFSLPHFSLRLFAKRKMFERKIRAAYRVENFRRLLIAQAITENFPLVSADPGFMAYSARIIW